MHHDILEIKRELEGLRVLFVEDEEQLRTQTARFLGKFFPHLETAANGEEGWARFRDRPYDLVITDLKMPRMGGAELVSKIRERSPETFTVITSGVSSGDIAADVAADARMVKPVSIDAFLAVMHVMISRRKAAPGT